MALSISKDTARQISDVDALHISMFPANGLLETKEQIRRFELLRLAFFVLKQRKLEQRGQTIAGARLIASNEDSHSEQDFHLSLLRHVIFQQVLTLIRLDAREQALQIIDACQK
jgi:hypothetical protein